MLLSAGELTGKLLLDPGNSKLIEQRYIVYGLVGQVLGHADVVAHVEVAQQVKKLEDIADVFAALSLAFQLAQTLEGLAINAYITFVDDLKRTYAVEERGLSAAG